MNYDSADYAKLRMQMRNAINEGKIPDKDLDEVAEIMFKFGAEAQTNLSDMETDATSMNVSNGISVDDFKEEIKKYYGWGDTEFEQYFDVFKNVINSDEDDSTFSQEELSVFRLKDGDKFDSSAMWFTLFSTDEVKSASAFLARELEEAENSESSEIPKLGSGKSYGTEVSEAVAKNTEKYEISDNQIKDKETGKVVGYVEGNKYYLYVIGEGWSVEDSVVTDDAGNKLERIEDLPDGAYVDSNGYIIVHTDKGEAIGRCVEQNIDIDGDGTTEKVTAYYQYVKESEEAEQASDESEIGTAKYNQVDATSFDKYKNDYNLQVKDDKILDSNGNEIGIVKRQEGGVAIYYWNNPAEGLNMIDPINGIAQDENKVNYVKVDTLPADCYIDLSGNVCRTPGLEKPYMNVEAEIVGKAIKNEADGSYTYYVHTQDM